MRRCCCCRIWERGLLRWVNVFFMFFFFSSFLFASCLFFFPYCCFSFFLFLSPPSYGEKKKIYRYAEVASAGNRHENTIYILCLKPIFQALSLAFFLFLSRIKSQHFGVSIPYWFNTSYPVAVSGMAQSS